MFRTFFKSKKIRNWIESVYEKGVDRSKLTTRIKIGLLLIALSFVIGWGGPAVMAVIAVWTKSLKTGLIGGSALYIFSWFVWGAGVLLTGKANYDFGRYFLAKFLKKKFFTRTG